MNFSHHPSELDDLSEQSVQSRSSSQAGQPYGNLLGLKLENILRLGYINIGGLGTRKVSSKDEFLYQYIQQKQMDIFGIGEVNNHWRKLS